MFKSIFYELKCFVKAVFLGLWVVLMLSVGTLVFILLSPLLGLAAIGIYAFPSEFKTPTEERGKDE